MSVSPRITYIGHSTVLLSMGDAHFLTDPLFADRIMVVKRKLPAGMALDALPPLAGVTISHAHTDHMNMPTLRRMDKNTPFFVPPGCAPFLEKKGFSTVSTLQTWEHVEVAGVTITSVPVNHVRGRFFPWQDTGVASYIYTLGGKNILVAGDVDFGSLSPFEEIASRFSIDVALLPVGGMREVAFYNKRHHKKNVHIDPETAWEIFTLLGAKTIIPIHWGAITVSKQPRDEAPLRLREIAGDKAGQCVTILYPGEGWSL